MSNDSQPDVFCKKHPGVKLQNVFAGSVGFCGDCGHNVGGATVSTLAVATRADFEQMTPQGKMDFIKSGGQITN